MHEEPFSNSPVDVRSIPKLDDAAFVPVDPNFLRVSLIGRTIFAVVVIGLSVALAIAGGDEVDRLILGAIVGGILVLILLSAVLKVIEVRNIAYQVREHDVSYRRGVLVKRVQTVPFVRVQHARLLQGPVHRLFNISTLMVSTAGPDISIAGLSSDDAARLRELVVERAGNLVEEQ